METQAETPNFTARIFELLDRVEYRRIQSVEDMEDVGRIRAKAFCGANLLPEATKVIIDEVDRDPQAYVFGVFYDEELISTIRIHHVTPDHRVSSSGKVFSAAMNQYLDAGMSLIDPARLASDADAFRELPGMHLLTMRLAVVATEYFGADRLVTTVRPQHNAFYRRMIEVAHRRACHDVRWCLHRAGQPDGFRLQGRQGEDLSPVSLLPRTALRDADAVRRPCGLSLRAAHDPPDRAVCLEFEERGARGPAASRRPDAGELSRRAPERERRGAEIRFPPSRPLRR